jgi:hypothetical protein
MFGQVETIRKGFQRLTCTCSERQLEQVGCECGAEEGGVVNVAVFLDGYASDRKGFFSCPERATDAEINAYVAREFGYSARAYEIRRPRPQPTETFSAEYIREMSKGG